MKGLHIVYGVLLPEISYHLEFFDELKSHFWKSLYGLDVHGRKWRAEIIMLQNRLSPLSYNNVVHLLDIACPFHGCILWQDIPCFLFLIIRTSNATNGTQASVTTTCKCYMFRLFWLGFGQLFVLLLKIFVNCWKAKMGTLLFRQNIKWLVQLEANTTWRQKVEVEL